MKMIVQHMMKLLLLFSAMMAGSLAMADVEHGKNLYEALCSQCHGLDGTGNGINAPKLEIAPRNHTDRAEMSARSDADLIKAISGGGQAVNKSVLMPKWENNLSEEEILDLVSYLRELCCSE